MRPHAPPLGPADVHLWVGAPDEVADPGDLAACRALLDPDEQAREDRLLFPRDRHLFRVAHALVRSTLSRYAPVEPGAWRFACNPHGRPEPEPAPGAPPLRFNLSHTHGLVICAVTAGNAVGADVEDHQRAGQTTEIADRFFAPPEVAALRALPPEQQRSRFFDHWTLKEAYMKARGVGLALGLENFWFDLHPGQPLRVAFGPAIPDDPARWRFWLLDPTPRHRAAVAVERDPAGDPCLRVWRCPPVGAAAEEVTGSVGLRTTAGSG